MHRIIDVALKHRFLVLLLFALFVLGGFYGLLHLTVDAVPDITNVQVQILAKSPALGPLEMEQFVTYPIETAMSGLPDLKEIRSISRYGLSVVTVIFKDNVDKYFSRQLVNERLSEAIEGIPGKMAKPRMGPLTTGLGEIYQFTLEGEGYSAMQLRTILDWEIAYRLRSVPGVVEVNTWGGLAKQYEVVIDPHELIAHRTTLEKVIRAVERNNANAGSGYIERNQEQYIIRGEALISNISDLENIVVDTGQGGIPIYLRQIAEIREGSRLRLGAATANGDGETVIGIVQMLAGENAQEVVRNVKEKISEIERSLPPGVRIVPYYDRAEFVNRVIRTVRNNLVEGGLLVVAILFLFLGSFGGGIIVSLAIPLSMLFAFAGMYAAGISGNLMSLGAIDFGLIVDGSVVMIENIMRKQARPSGIEPAEVIRQGGREVARPVFFSVLIITLVYFPVFALTGTEGRMFRPMAITVILALIGSLAVALILMPALASIFLSRSHRPHDHSEEIPDHQDIWIMRKLRNFYTPVLRLAMRHRIATFSMAVLIFLAGLSLFSGLGGEFVPRLDEGDIVIQAWRLPSVSMRESLKSTSLLERILLRFPEVEKVVSRTGSPEVATDIMGIELSDVFVNLKPRSQWATAQTKEELIDKMSHAITGELPAVGISFTQPIEMRFNELIAGIRSDVGVEIFGYDLVKLQNIGQQVSRILNSIQGATDVRVEQVAGLPMIRVAVNRDEIARYGMNASDVLESVEASRVGHHAGTIFEGEKRFPLMVRLNESVTRDLSTLAALPVDDPQGRVIPLGQVATVEYATGPAQISRSQIQRRLVVEANVRGRDLASFVETAQERIAREVALEPGYFIDWGGEFENLERAMGRLKIVVPLTLFLIFILLYMALASIRLSLLIFLNVPLAIAGGVFALFLRGIPFSISAGVGFIALFGIAVLNGIVLVTYIRQARAENEDPDDAAFHAAQVRFRPVMMTAAVASLGFLPMALSHGMGAEVQRPLATVVIGGLITSTMLTLLVLPAIYGWFAEKREVKI